MKPKLSTVAGMLALMLALYVLSTGPVYRFYVNPNRHPGEIEKLNTYEKFYAPLSWLCGKWPMAGDAFDWYFRLWYRPER